MSTLSGLQGHNRPKESRSNEGHLELGVNKRLPADVIQSVQLRDSSRELVKRQRRLAKNQSFDQRLEDEPILILQPTRHMANRCHGALKIQDRKMQDPQLKDQMQMKCLKRLSVLFVVVLLPRCCSTTLLSIIVVCLDSFV